MSEHIRNIIKKNLDVIGIFALMVSIFAYIMFVVKWNSEVLFGGVGAAPVF